MLGNKVVEVKPYLRQKYKTPNLPIVSTVPASFESTRLPTIIAPQPPTNVLVGMSQKPKVSTDVITSVSKS